MWRRRRRTPRCSPYLAHISPISRPLSRPYLAHISPASRAYLAHISQVQAMSTTHSIRAIRRNYWWEKFFWFVSSENYIVVGGRDAQQNEQLVREIYGRCRGDVGEI